MPEVEHSTALAQARRDPGWEPSLQDAVAFYHEIAAASDLGRSPVRGLSEEELGFARRTHPLLLEHVRGLGQTDAAAEVLIGAAILGQRGEAWIGEGIDWLLGRQRDDGSYVRAGQRPEPSADERRHGILTVTWALLAHLGSR